MQQPSERQIFFERDHLPEGMKALVIRVKVPRLYLIADTHAHEQTTIFDDRMVYVEISPDEWLRTKDDPAAADALSRECGPLIQQALGAAWHRWHDQEWS